MKLHEPDLNGLTMEEIYERGRMDKRDNRRAEFIATTAARLLAASYFIADEASGFNIAASYAVREATELAEELEKRGVAPWEVGK